MGLPVQPYPEHDWPLRSDTPAFNDSKKEEVYHVFERNNKKLLVILVSIVASFSPLAGNIFLPVLSDVAKDTGATPNMVSLSVTSFMIGQAVIPSLFGPLTDVIGRRQILLYTMLLFVIANLGLTFAHKIEPIIAFRFLQAMGCASSSSIGAGIIADIAPSSERGGFMGILSGIRQFSLALGPVIGGVLAGTLGYQSIFWALFIHSAIMFLVTILLLPETLRSIAGNGSVPLKGILYAPTWGRCAPWRKAEAAGEHYSGAELKAPKITLRMFYEPLLFLFEKDIFCTLFYGSIIFTVWSMVSASTSMVLERAYGLSTIQIGLAFLPNAIGCALGSIVGGKQLDRDYHAAEDSYKYMNDLPKDFSLPKGNPPPDFPIEKARLHQLPIMSAICAFGVVLYGFAVTSGESIVVPLMAQFAVGYSSTVVLNLNNLLTVDLYPGNSASAASVNNLARYMIGAFGVGLTEVALEHLSPAWFFLILGGSIVVASPMAWLEWRFGPTWREERRVRLMQKEERKQETKKAEP